MTSRTDASGAATAVVGGSGQQGPAAQPPQEVLPVAGSVPPSPLTSSGTPAPPVPVARAAAQPATTTSARPSTPPTASLKTGASSASTAPGAPGSSAAVPLTARGTGTGAEAQVLALVNQERVSAGCPALVADAALAALARAHSEDMRDREFFEHTNPDGRSPFDRAQKAGVTTMRAENIAQGQPTSAAVMAAWMASPGHRANILNCNLRTLGVGIAYGSSGPWWTQDFGS